MTEDPHDELFLPEHLSCFTGVLKEFTERYSDFSSIHVAFSGGLDSTVLLHLLAQSSALKERLLAHHIDHGLQEDAADWVKHCSLFCLSLAIPFKSSTLEWTSVKREGVESVARRLRYQALTTGCKLDTDILVTGHHQRDQAETVLLNLARGSGVSGLAAMPYVKTLSTVLGEVLHCRPLLSIPYQQLKLYAQYFKLHWVGDPSNALTHYRRNAVRQEVLPVLSRYWPAVEKSLARTADHMSEAQLLLNRMAAQALAKMEGTEFYFDFDWLNDLDWLEQKNTLRYWLLKQFTLTLSARHYDWVKQVLAQQAKSRQNAFSYQTSLGELCFYGKRLYFLKNSLLPYCFKVECNIDLASLFKGGGQALALCLDDRTLVVHRTHKPAQTAHYHFQIEFKYFLRLSGLMVRNISQEDVVNRKKLKSFFQKNKIPPWERSFWPVLTYHGAVVSVLGCASCLKSTEINVSGEEGVKGKKQQPPVQKISLSKEACYRVMGVWGE